MNAARSPQIERGGKRRQTAEALRGAPAEWVETSVSAAGEPLGPANRCLVPFTSFSEPDQVGGSLQPVWFALSEERPLAFFAGLWTPWTCVRKIKEGEITCDLFGLPTSFDFERLAVVRAPGSPSPPLTFQG